MNASSVKIPTWFWVVAVIILLWNIMGIVSFAFHSVVMTGEALNGLPENERALYGEYPLWTKIVFGIATFSGLLGAIFLLAKKAKAQLLFVISLIAVIIQMFHNLFLTSSVEVYGIQAYIMPIFVVVMCIFSIWFCNKSINKGWIK